jgi:uncharacterized protein YprB with RNaseH-like and TPR domain
VISTAIFDLETSDLAGDKGIILCGCIQSSTRKEMITIRTDDTNKKWKSGKRGDDSATAKQIADVLSKHDVLVAHNGTRFDLPFLRTRLARWGMPRLPDMKIVDPLSVAWRKLRMTRNSLGNIADHIGIKDRKTPLNMSVWMDAILNGSRKSMDLIVEHCVADVKVLAGVLELVKPYVKLLDDRGSAL